MEIRITWKDPTSGEEQQYEGDLPITVGRKEDNTIVLEDDRVSRHHARFEAIGPDELGIVDLGTGNGTFVNDERVEQAALNNGDGIRIGSVTLTVHFEVSIHDAPTRAEDVSAIQEVASAVAPEKLETAEEPVVKVTHAEKFPPTVFEKQQLSMADLQATGLPIDEATYLTIGGGLGSYISADHLVIYGANTADIQSIGFEDKPYAKYRRYCINSQIPDHERLRSHSSSTPDNIWGWPGYAVREIATSLASGDLRLAALVAWRIFAEPVFDQTYTPRSGRVFDSIDREAARIGWNNIWRYGSVRSIRKTDDGHYVVAYSQTRQSGADSHKLMVGKYLHIAVGYPAIRLLPDLMDYRERTDDFKAVVNAYEEHDHVYQQLKEHGGTVLIRGRGIVASRIIQRLVELREENPNVGILHLLRSPLTEGYKSGLSQREVDSHWEFQPFNWPKGAWGGVHLLTLENASDAERAKLVPAWEGTTTADRHDWRRMVQDGLREGWYTIHFGEVDKVERGENGQLLTHIQGKANQTEAHIATDFIIDSTGLIAGVDDHRLLKDLLDHYNLKRNGLNRLLVSNAFEMEEMRNGDGRMYAAGIATLGGPVASVDSFLGLQIAALRSVDHLAKIGAPGVHYLNGLRSVRQWIRWARGIQP